MHIPVAPVGRNAEILRLSESDCHSPAELRGRFRDALRGAVGDAPQFGVVVAGEKERDIGRLRGQEDFFRWREEGVQARLVIGKAGGAAGRRFEPAHRRRAAGQHHVAAGDVSR
jgi:hypothetical protein